MQLDFFDQKAVSHYPSTRYQGSKRKLIPALSAIFSQHKFSTAIDLFSGSGSVTYLLRTLGKSVTSNDYLKYNANTASLFLSEVSDLDILNSKRELPSMLNDQPHKEGFAVRKNYSNIFFTDAENTQIDYFCKNVQSASAVVQKLLIYAVGQALLKKRPYNLFHRANLAMRLSDVERSFGNKVTWETSIEAHAIKTLNEISKLSLQTFVTGSAMSENTNNLEYFPSNVDLIYLDPPYIPAKGKAIDYADFYGFLDGLLDYGLFEKPNIEIPHRPVLQSPSAWCTPKTARIELLEILKKWKNSLVIMSYRGDGAFSPEDILSCFSLLGRNATVECLGTYKYALAHSIRSNEILIISPPA